MEFRYLWPLALLILIPVIVIMYLVKQKAEPRTFSSLFLWHETYRNMHADTPWEKLKKNLLMVMQILTVLALVIALMSPYIRSKAGSTGHVILVIDNSASMQTMYDEKYTRLETAVASAVAHVNELTPGTTVTVVSSNKDAVILLSDSADKSLAIKRLKSIEATNYTGSCDSATTLVRSMAAQWDSCEVIYYTDTMVTNGFTDTNGYIVDVYSYAENASVDYVSHSENDDGTYTILAKITNNTGNPLTCEANLYGDGRIIAVSDPLDIPAKESQVIYFENISFDGNSVSVELNDFDDALAADNTAYDILSDIKDCRALLITDQNIYLEKAISLIDGIEVIKTDDIESFSTEGLTDEYDLYIFDGKCPESFPETGNLLIINTFDDTLCTADTELSGIRVYTADSKVTGYLTDYSFGVSSATAIKCPTWAEPFLTATHDSTEYCIGCFGTENGRNVCMIGFDFHNSDLPLKMEFPILIYNIMSECAGTGMLSSTVVNAGNTVQINGKATGTAAVVTLPDASKVTLSSAVAAFSDTADTGIYSVSSTVDGDKLTEFFAVNFPRSENTITSSAALSAGSENVVKAETVANTTLSLRNYAIILILLLLAAEWIIYLRGL